MSKAIVLGAGVSGLSAGWKLAEGGMDVIVLERDPWVGGMARTFRHGDFLLDCGPHKIFTLMDDVMADIRDLVGDELLEVPKRSRIRLMGRYLNYPVGVKDLLLGFSPLVAAQFAASYGWTLARGALGKPADRSYRDWVVHRFGKAIFDRVFGPYADKIWGPPDSLDPELAATRVAVPNLYQMLKQMVFGRKTEGVVMSAETFFYPRYGAGTLSQRMADRIAKHGGTIRLSTPAVCVHTERGRISGVELQGGEVLAVGADDWVVGTLPLALMTRLVSPAAPAEVVDAARSLKTRNLILLYLVVSRPRVSDDNWIFFPGQEYRFNRLYEPKNWSPDMVPFDDRTVLCLEITCDPGSAYWTRDLAAIREEVVPQLEEAGLIRRDEVLDCFDVRMPSVYQIYDIAYRDRLRVVVDYFDRFANFYTIGRHGAFNYVGMADSMDMGKRTAGHILAGGGARTQLRSQFDSYIVID